MGHRWKDVLNTSLSAEVLGMVRQLTSGLMEVCVTDVIKTLCALMPIVQNCFNGHFRDCSSLPLVPGTL